MKVHVEDVSQVKKRITVEIPVEVVEEAVKEAYKELKKDAEVEGFRRGNVPENILKQKFAVKVIGDVAARLVEKSYLEVIKEKSFLPVAKPDIEIRAAGEDKPISYIAMVDVRPVIDVKEYKHIHVERKEITVSQEEVEENMKLLRESYGTFEEVKEPADTGDMVIVDFHATAEGKPLVGRRAKDYRFVLGTETAMFPEFDEALKGKSAKDTVTFTKPFPSGYHDKTLAGKEVTFHIIVKGIKRKRLPEINEAFAKDLNCADLEELKEKVIVEIKKVKEKNELDRVKKEIVDRLIEKTPFEAPEPMVNRYYVMLLNKVMEGVRQGVVNPRDTDLTSDEFKSRYRVLATEQVRGDLILDVIAEKENIKVTEDDVNRLISDIAASRGIAPDAIKTKLNEEGTLDVLAEGIKRDKVFGVLLAGC